VLIHQDVDLYDGALKGVPDLDQVIAKMQKKTAGLAEVFKLYTFKQIDGRWVATKSQMWTKADGHTTFLYVDDVDTKTPVSPADFTPDALSKG
jgi:hypothetical protein